MSVLDIKMTLKSVFSDDFFENEEFLMLEEKTKFIPRMRLFLFYLKKKKKKIFFLMYEK